MSEMFFDKDLAETMSYWATAAGIVLALAAGAYALWRFRTEQKNEAGNQARNAYGEFMRLALQYPEFYPGCWKSIEPDPVQRNKFEWYIAHFLWASEDILMYDPYDKSGYVAGIKDTILEHQDYFNSAVFQNKERSGYCLPLQKLIGDILHDYELADLKAE